MPKTVYRMLTVLCRLVVSFPVGTNLGLVHLLWMLVSGRLLDARGAVIPALSASGLSERAVRRAWVALGQGDWTITALLARWKELVGAEGTWQPHTHGGYHPVGVDVTGFWRPRLQDCPTRHYNAEAGKALPAIPLGLIGRTGSVGGQRLALPLAMVRADPADPRPSTQERLLVRAAVAQCAEDDALVLDAGFDIAVLQEEGATRYVVRVAKNSTFRRTSPPAYGGRGRPPTRGVLVRPLARTYKGRLLDATPPDRTQTWLDEGVEVRAEIWDDLLLPDAAPGSPTFAVVAVHDPRYREPLLLASPLPLPAQALHALYHDRWPVEQLPLAAKQMLGAARAFVHAPETCQRLPELALLAGAILILCRGEQPGYPHRLLGSPPPTDAGPLAAGTCALSFSAQPPPPGTNSRKSGDHSPPAHGILGATAPRRPRARGDPPISAPNTAF